MKNNLGCSFKTLLALENGIVFQYRSYTFIKIHIWKYYQRFSIRNYRCLICILSCTSFSQIILKMKSWSFQHSFLWSFCSPSPAGILKNTQNIFKRNIYILVFETIQNIFSLSCFPLHPHKSMSLATEIVFLRKPSPVFPRGRTDLQGTQSHLGVAVEKVLPQGHCTVKWVYTTLALNYKHLLQAFMHFKAKW